MGDVPEVTGGDRHRIRIFAETLHQLREVLTESDSFGTRFDPGHWRGPAHTRFTGALRVLAGQWERLRGTNTDVTARVTGHSNFLYELPKLIEEFPHLATAEGTSTAELIAVLDAAADELDRIGHEPPRSAVPAPAGPVRAQSAAPVLPEWPTDDPDDPPPSSAGPSPPPNPPGPAPLAAAGSDGGDPLRAAMLTGRRTPTIPWHG